MNKIKINFPLGEVDFNSFLSDFELIKSVYADNLSIVEENNDEKRLIFNLSLFHDVEAGTNIKEIVLDLKIDNYFKLEAGNVGLPYTVKFEIFPFENQIIVEIETYIHWLKKQINTFSVFNESVKNLDKETFIFNFLEALKAFIPSPPTNTLISWFQDVKEENISRSTSQDPMHETEEEVKENSENSDSLRKLKARADSLNQIKRQSLKNNLVNSSNSTQKEANENQEYDKFFEIGGIVGETVTDRNSTFQSHVIRVESMNQINKILKYLKSNNKIQKATHNIYVYRFQDETKKVAKSKSVDESITEGFDDDGEEGAGNRLLTVLQKMKVYNFLVVVSRWYGGINLGNDRFRHINDSAKKIILSYKSNFDWIN